MAVLVLGAQGALGRLCVESLRADGFDVVRAGRRREDAADFRCLDLDDADSVTKACEGAELVVCAVRHPLWTAERAVLGAGGLLLNVASLRASDRAELKALPEGSRGLVVVDAGLAPGVYSLALKEMLAEHPEADGLEIAGAWSLTQTSGPAGAVDFFHTAVHRAGRRLTRRFDFPPPIGRRRCLHVGGEEIGFFGGVADTRSAAVYFAFTERLAHQGLLGLNAAGLLQRLPRRALTVGRRWTQRRTTTEPKRDLVAVVRDGRRLAGCSVHGNGDYQMTAQAAAVFARALLDRRAQQPSFRGVWGADELFDFGDLKPAFEQHGIGFEPLQ